MAKAKSEPATPAEKRALTTKQKLNHIADSLSVIYGENIGAKKPRTTDDFKAIARTHAQEAYDLAVADMKAGKLKV